MEPENKKEIMLAWWKFVGFQFAIVVIVSLSFFSAKFYPDEVKNDYKKLNSKWKKTKDKYKEAESQMVKINLIVQAYEKANGQLPVSEFQRLQTLSSQINDKMVSSSKVWPYYNMPNLYQLLANKYIDADKKAKAASAGNAEANNSATQNQMFMLQQALVDEKAKLTDYKDTHCPNLRGPGHP